MNSFSNLIFLYIFFIIFPLDAMLKRRPQEKQTVFPYYGSQLYYNSQKYLQDSQRYLQKQTDPDLTKKILGLVPDQKEKSKNDKVYCSIKQYIQTQFKIDKYPQDILLNEYNADEKENLRIALSRGPMATNYLIELLMRQPDLDAYHQILTSNTLLKFHAASFLYGMGCIVSTGHYGQIIMKEKHLDNKERSDVTKLSLFLVLLNYLMQETQAINTELLFELPEKERLNNLITDLQNINSKLV